MKKLLNRLSQFFINQKQLLGYLIFFSILILGVYMINEHINTFSLKDLTAEQLSSNPELLNGKTLTGAGTADEKGEPIYVKNLLIENVTLKNVTFKDVALSNASFKNVIFEDCTFSGFKVEQSDLERVIFKGGIMQPSRTPAAFYDFDTEIDSSNIKDVVFDGVAFDTTSLSGNGKGGIIKFKNINKIYSSYGSPYPFSVGTYNAHVIVEDCIVEKERLIDFYKDDHSTLYVKNSRFKNGASMTGTVDALYIDNCDFSSDLRDKSTQPFFYPKFNSSYIPRAKQGVVTNSHIDGIIMQNGIFYLTNNTYGSKDTPAEISISTDKFNSDTHAYIFGDPNKTTQMELDIRGGATVYNMELVNMKLFGVIYDWKMLEEKGLPKDKRIFLSVPEANFKNVTIRGGDWSNLILEGGKWENVNIYPEINMDNASINNVKAYNVNYPEGAPFRGTPSGNTTINVSKTPLDWPEIHVPTFEELGFNRELPEITGKP